MAFALEWIAALAASTVLRTLLHELSHAAVALRVTTRPVVVLVGKPLIRMRCGRLTLCLGLGETGGACVFANPPSSRARAAIAAAGPAASLLTALLAAACFFVLAGSSLRSPGGIFCALLTGSAGIDALANGWPRARARGLYGTPGNDGYSVAREMGWIEERAFVVGRPAAAPALAPATPPRPDAPTTRPWAMIVLGIVTLFALFVAPLAALAIVVLFGLAALQTREHDHAKRMSEARRDAKVID